MYALKQANGEWVTGRNGRFTYSTRALAIMGAKALKGVWGVLKVVDA